MAYITGVSMVNVDRHYDKGVKRLAAEAASKALDEAEPDTLDYIIVSSSFTYASDPQLDIASYIASYSGLRGVRALTVEAGESSGLAAVSVAKSLIDSGSASRVLVVGVDKLSDRPTWEVYKHFSKFYNVEGEGLYSIGMGGIAGILMRLYMENFKVDRLTLAYWPALMHSNAKLNPYAMLRFSITPEKVLESPPVADPITLLDSFPLGDGAAALVIEGSGRGNALAELAAVESATGYPSIALVEDPLKLESLERAYQRLTRKVNIKDVDIVELHDSFTIMGILELEALRLSEWGKAAEAVSRGYFSVGGEGPVVNPSGGLKARGHPIGATGVYQVAEVSLQLAGEFPGVKVPDSRYGLAVSVNGSGSNAYIAYLRSVG